MKDFQEILIVTIKLARNYWRSKMTKQILKIALIGIFAISFTGCVGSIDTAIKKYNKVAPKINLGDSKEKVLSILLPTQEGLDPEYAKLPEKYLKDDKRYEIYYMRSLRQPDGFTTDDEFTPYLFVNGKLQSIGWAALGGAANKGVKR
jgi:hypothetical protein